MSEWTQIEGASSGWRVIERQCGGWLAVSARPLAIGVTAPTRGEACDKLQQAVSKWLGTIEHHRNPTASDWEAGQDVETARSMIEPERTSL